MTKRQKEQKVWQCWVIFYLGLWILASGFLFGRELMYSNILFGALIALFSFWAGLKAKQR